MHGKKLGTETARAITAAFSKKARRRLSYTCLFAAFAFLQFTVLGMANHAGEGYLATEQRDMVYYALQVFVILGYLLHALHVRLCSGARARTVVAYGVFGAFSACVIAMLATGTDSLAYVIVSLVAALCVGGIGGAVHLRMSLATASCDDVALCMGLGSATAVAMQYLLHIQWGATPLLPVFMLAAIALLPYLLRKAPHSVARAGAPQHTPPRRIATTALVSASFVLFACFYNEHIHHLMIQSNYEAYTVYSWPRLMLVPGYLLFAAIGDRNGGRYVPLASLCTMLIALLNVVLVDSQGAYWLNMCLFYLAIAAFTSYYLLTFWRLAPGTARPALWAPFGRMLDSAMVLLTGAVHLSELSAPAVLGMDIAGFVVVVVLMAVGGDLNLATETTQEAYAAPEPVPTPTLEERTRLLAHTCGLTEREGKVLALLVLTEDTNQRIANRLGISRRQLQTHIAHIYEKSGTTTRAGLVMRASDEQRR